jgi:hypothetical protein
VRLPGVAGLFGLTRTGGVVGVVDGLPDGLGELDVVGLVLVVGLGEDEVVLAVAA